MVGAKSLTDEAKRWNAVENFCKPFDFDDPDKDLTGIAFLIVCDMLLTGFDAPVEQVMYIDKRLKEHNLLQAIARVNRVTKNKHRGFIVDYIGLANHLAQALAIYSKEDAQDIQQGLKNLLSELPILEERYERLLQHFRAAGVGKIDAFVKDELPTPEAEVAVVHAAVGALKDIKLRADFDAYLKTFLQSLNLILPNQAGNAYRGPARRFGYLLRMAKERYKDDTIDIADAGAKVKALINEHLVDLGINPKIPPIELLADDFIANVQKHAQGDPEAKASEMEHAIRKHCTVHFDEDPAFYKRLSEKLEKLIQRPRHVEVQVFADSHGNVVHLFERDCSLQRRHQKVIEEAPAPGLSARLRHTLGIAAVAAATAIRYEGAGTVEFILDLDATDKHGDPAFYFMEMNTRLQVEHPVTECITGYDLVEWQLRVARGEMLPAHQEAIGVTGHAMEARLYAEDPDSGFLPSTGTLTALAFGAGEGVRIDTGVETGSRIGLDYDPMIAKVIAWGPDRATAIDRLVGALGGTVVEGLKSNRAFLARLADHPAFRAGDVDTGFIARHADALAPAREVPEAALLMAALAGTLETPAATLSAFGRCGFRMNLREERYFRFWSGETMHALSIRNGAAGRFHVNGLETIAEVGGMRRGGEVTADIGGTLVTAHIVQTADTVEIRLAGQTYILARRAPRKGAVAGASDGRIIAPMPGRVLEVDVKIGDIVEAGDRLLVLEAMKMEHRIMARAAGSISAVHIAAGDQVADGMLLVEIG